MCVAFALVYGLLALLRYRTFHSRSLDMAYYVRLVWGMAHGRPDNPVVDAPHWLGLHLEPALLPLAAISRLGLPIAELLLIAQAIAAALALPPMLALARRRLAPVAGEAGAFAAALAIYLVPTVSRCLDYDFHPTTMAIAPLAAWIEAVDARRFRRAWCWLAVSLAFREDIGLQVAAAALTFVAWPAVQAAGSRRRMLRRQVVAQMALQAAVGALWFLVYALAVQPRFLPDPASGSFGAHFAGFGGGAGGVAGVVREALREPVALARHVTSADRPYYPLWLLATVGGVALAAPRWLAGALPVLAINLLSDFPGVRRVESHYATTMAPFLVAAAIGGATRLGALLGRRAPRLAPAPAAVVLLAGMIGWWTHGAAPGAPDFSLASYRPDAFTREGERRVAALSGEPRVVADVRVLAHLAERAEPRIDPEQRLYWKK